MNEKKRSLGTKVVQIVLLFSLLIIIAASTVVSVMYRSNIMEKYSQLGRNYVMAAAAYINGDTVKGYLETGETDDYYEEVETYLEITSDHSELKYLYVYIPTEEDLIYVWDSGECELGDHEGYMEGGKDISYEVFRKDPTDRVLISRDKTYGYIASVFYPVFDSAGEPVAIVGTDISMPGINAAIMDFARAIAITIVILMAVLGFAIYKLIQKKLVIPVQTLDHASREMVHNLESDAEITIPIKTGDELENLGKSFEQMHREIREYIQKLSAITAEKERIGAELNVATGIQAHMLPSIFPAYPDRTDIDIYAFMKPAKEVGGDFYDFFFVDDTHLAVVMADVSGKGVPAALFMVIAKTLIKTKALTGASPSEVLSVVNNQLCENNEAEMFVTVWLGVLDLTTGRMVASNAGHEYPVFRKAGGRFEMIRDKHGFVLAGMENLKYTDYEIQFEPGDTLCVYTDGAPEATNAAEELFGMERLLEVMSAESDASCEQTLTLALDGIQSFVGEAPQFDDVTMLCLTYNGEKKEA